MKTILLTAFLLLVTSTFAQTYVTIPDANFAKWLRDSVPSAMNGDQLDISSDAVINKKTIVAEALQIKDITGVEYFTNLETLDVGNEYQIADINKNQFSTLPNLPENLKTLICGNTGLVSLPILPKQLSILKCYSNSLTTLPILPETLTYLDCNSNQLVHLPQLPTSLINLQCYMNQLIDLPELPQKLMWFSCYTNQLTSLPQLPNSLIHFVCAENQITSLPQLPESLVILRCHKNLLTSLPQLPNTLTELTCSYNQLKALPVLPTSLIDLDCNTNFITTLPELPGGISRVILDENPLGGLPLLPFSLTLLTASRCGLSTLPSLPPKLEFLGCSLNQLSTLPELPNTLISLSCFNSKITCFPKFPKSLTSINISNNPFTCLPNYLPCMDKVTLSYPLCTEGNTSGCPSAEEGIVGFTSKDENADCKKDEKEKGISNLPMMLLDANNNVIAQTITAENGVYQFSSLDATTYQVQLDKDNIPFAVACNDKQAVDLTNQTYAKEVNFSLTCKDGIDVGVRSISTTGIIFPGQSHILTVAAGDMSNWYNMHCAAGTAGKLQLTISGPVVYKGIIGGALTPIITGNVYTYEIADFGNVNFTEDFGIEFETETTAQAGDQICIEAQITTTSGDFNLANNQYSFCYSVVNSHDPNLKEVFPANFKPGYDGYLTYTVHFQNTGSAPAFNIRLLDTLDSQLDLSTFEVLNYSHANRVELKGNIMQVFYNNIHLLDSTSNEKASHGFIQYRIKPKKAIAESDQIKNTAYIYFDFNEAVVTNTTISKANKSAGLEQKKESTLRVYPNPTETIITLERATASNAKLTVQMLNVNGQEVYATTIENTTNHSIDVSAYTPGLYFLNVVSDTSSEVIKVVKK